MKPTKPSPPSAPRFCIRARLHNQQKKQHTQSPNTGRPGSPHSKKRAPPPAQHQRESSAAPPQSTAVFHFWEQQCACLPFSADEADKPSPPSAPRFCIRARLHNQRKKQHNQIQGGQVHPIARSVLHLRPNINANRRRPHPKVLPCSILGTAVPQPDRLTHQLRSRLIQVSYLGTTLNPLAEETRRPETARLQPCRKDCKIRWALKALSHPLWHTWICCMVQGTSEKPTLAQHGNRITTAHATRDELNAER